MRPRPAATMMRTRNEPPTAVSLCACCDAWLWQQRASAAVVLISCPVCGRELGAGLGPPLHGNPLVLKECVTVPFGLSPHCTA